MDKQVRGRLQKGSQRGGKIKHLKKFCFGGVEEDEKGRRGGAQKRLRVEGGVCVCGRDGRTTMPCSSIGLSDHIRSRGKRRDMGET